MDSRARTMRLLLVVVLVTFVGAGFAGLVARERRDDATAAETDTQRTVTAAGEGRVALPPDIVMLTVGVDISDTELATAQASASDRMTAVLAALADKGVDQTDIQTASYAIYVDRDYSRVEQPVTGYHVVHTVQVKIRAIERAGETLQATVDAGANTVGNIWFALEDSRAAIEQARALAVSDARAKADDLARLTSATLGPVLTITESSSSAPPATPYLPGGERDDTGGGTVTPINPGQTEVTVYVTIVWAIS